jgi:hypothetical protein
MKNGQISKKMYYSGEDIVTFILDPGNAVVEPLENNNAFSAHIRPVAVRQKTWGKIKALYGD